MSNALALEHQGPIGLITMNRPERHNAFDDALIQELTEALRSMEADDMVRIVVLSGVGRSFSAGADLNWMKRMAGFSKDENVRDAIAAVRPWGVDAASSLEREPGVKDHDKVRAYVEAARS